MKVFFIILTMVGIWFTVNQMIGSKEKNQYEYWQMGAYLDMAKQECGNSELGFEVKVRFAEIPEGDVIGRWTPWNNTITLEEIDIDTIAHEVYHMSKTMGERYHLEEDEEYLAYMQGYFTNCVYMMAHPEYLTTLESSV